ncbi:nitroreductase family protein [Sorangium sp. So ce429]
MLDRRQTKRQLRPASLERLGAWLWHAARTRGTGARTWEHRAAPSSGGLHPIELVVVPHDAPEAFRYDSLRHALARLADVDQESLVHACAELRTIVPGAKGSLIVLGGHLARTAAIYENADSLIWRDAGCLLTVLQLVATWLNLGVCPLGALGTGVIRAIRAEEQLVPAGVVIVGEDATVDET